MHHRYHVFVIVGGWQLQAGAFERVIAYADEKAASFTPFPSIGISPRSERISVSGTYGDALWTISSNTVDEYFPFLVT